MQASAGDEKGVTGKVKNDEMICRVDLDYFRRQRTSGTDVPLFSRRGRVLNGSGACGMRTAEHTEGDEDDGDLYNAMVNHVEVVRPGRF